MPTKAELYAQMADKVATQLTGSWQEWAGFLLSLIHIYRCAAAQGLHECLIIWHIAGKGGSKLR